MSQNNIQVDGDAKRYQKVRAAFIVKGTTLTAWCAENGTRIQNVRDAMFGRWKGPRAEELVARVVEASGAE